MEVEVTFLSRRGTAIMRRSQRSSGERVRIGRGTDNEVRLGDIHVGLHAAALVMQDGQLAIERLDNSLLEVNGTSVEAATLRIGDEVRLGPYRIEILAPPSGCDGAIQIELAQPMGASAERVAGMRVGLDRTSASKRAYAWTGFLVIVVVCLAVPIIVFSGGFSQIWQRDTTSHPVPKAVGLSWNAGEFSNAHRFFAADCATCHQGAFSRVADAACLACHNTVGGHVPHGVGLGSVGDKLAASRCIDCHTEHRGLDGSVIRTAGLCLDCHRNMAEAAPATGVSDVRSFPGGHPQFRATLVADAAKDETARVALGASPPPVNRPGIKFLHKEHLDTLGRTALGDRQVKGCPDCHVPDPAGQGFMPITYKDQCQRCHELTFDKVALPWQDAKVPHGDDRGVIAAVWNFYAGLALHGGMSDEPPASPAVERRGAGNAPPAAPSALLGDAQAWVATKSATAVKIIFDPKRGCAYCHYSTAADGAWNIEKMLSDAMAPAAPPAHVVAPVVLRSRFLPWARFDHASHRGMTCVDCHAVKEASADGEALMIPGKENCVRCHGGENASLRAQSTCISCHEFHHQALGPMRVSAGATQ